MSTAIITLFFIFSSVFVRLPQKKQTLKQIQGTVFFHRQSDFYSSIVNPKTRVGNKETENN